METLEMTTDFVIKKITTAQKGIINVRATITSWGPGLLMNPMTSDLLDELAGIKPRVASDKDVPLQERAERKVIRENGEGGGKIGIPVTYILAALIFAGRYVKNGKKQISTATSTTIYEFLSMEDEFFPFTNQDEQMIVDKRRGVSNNAGKTAAVAIIRPKFKNWEISMNIGIDTNIISPEVVKQLFAEAGRKAGICDFRPMRKGPFGMFSLTGWEVLN
jgi:hypothetical protein